MTDNNNKNSRKKALQWLGTTATFTHSQLCANSDLPTGSVKALIRRLLKCKAIKCIKKRTPTTPAKYRVIDLTLMDKPSAVQAKNTINGRKTAWEWILINPNFTQAKLIENTGVKKSLANNFIALLIKEKRIKCKAKRQGSIGARYKLVDSSPLLFGTGNRIGRRKTTGKTPTQQQKIWNAIRIYNKFTFSDLAAGTNNDVKVVSQYVNALTKAGIVRCTHTADKVKNTPAHFILVRNLGLLSPIRCDDSIYDRNREERHPFLNVDKASKSKPRRHVHGQATRLA